MGSASKPLPIEGSSLGVSGANALSAFDSESSEPSARSHDDPSTPAKGPVDGAAVSGSSIVAVDHLDRAQPKSLPVVVKVPLPVPSSGMRQPLVWLTAAIAVLAVTVVAVILIQRRTPSAPAAPAPTTTLTPTPSPQGQVTLETTPPGAEVVLQGVVKGVTPLKLSMDPGRYEFVLRRGADERPLPIDVTAGTAVLQRVEFATAVSTAKLSIVTEPAGARVSIDGQPRGNAPITISDITPGRHRIAVSGPGGTAERTVTTEAGATMSVMFSLASTPALEIGWLTIVSPFEVKVMERDEVIGTSASSKIIVPTGVHELDLSSASLGYQAHRRISVDPGKTTELRVDAKAAVNINARPWADVLIDGASVGLTPLANLSLNLGSHDALFRHPDLGERKQTILVTAQGPNRISVDMTK